MKLILKMKVQELEKTNWEFIDYLGFIVPIINVVLWIIVIYAIVKLYKKLIKFLDKNS